MRTDETALSGNKHLLRYDSLIAACKDSKHVGTYARLDAACMLITGCTIRLSGHTPMLVPHEG